MTMPDGGPKKVGDVLRDFFRMKCPPLPDQGECEECGRKFRNADVDEGFCQRCGLPMPDGQEDER